MKKSEWSDIIQVVIILVILVAGFFYTLNGLFSDGGVSSSHNRYYEAHEDY